MKTKLVIFSIFVSLVFLSCKNNENNTNNNSNVNDSQKTVEYSLNLDNSVVNWKGSMVGLYNHFGTLKFSEGKISINGNKVVSGSFKVDMNTMLATDPEANYPMAPREKLIEHLKSNDFFNTNEFPYSSLEITGVKGNDLTAKLTIRGITNEEIIKDIIVKNENGIYTITGKLTFDRQKYSVSYTSTMKDKVLSNDIELEVVLVTK